MRLAGKIALITGGARGIGAATARRFVAEGARVAIADRRVEEGQALAGALNAEFQNPSGEAALFIELDVADEQAWREAVETVRNRLGPIDVLVNNAGVIRVAPIEETDLTLFRKVVDTNLAGTFLGIRSVLETMTEGGGGSIINFSSPQGIEGRENMSAYAASKFGIRGLTKTASIELGPKGIRVNAVIPGPTRTKMTERKGWSDADYDAAYGRYPLGRMGEAAEIAEVVVFLASDESSFCTGGDFVVDGGILAGKPRA
ncbi:MAG: glucose 1-dehydrogenase [Deltaproteobacteria bacterium]|jgi:3alpha(or 20beta)-hydroxysteroid dehydrogenase|nr:glucose 1-dehydrogenase [Deltaproteobacteria bacterium]